MMLLMISGVSYADQVEVKIADYDVSINGNIIDNVHSEYPVINYKNITYFPMTYDYVGGTGLRLKYDADEGLRIALDDELAIFNQMFLNGNNVLGGSDFATLVNYPVFVNKREIDNMSEEYPLLNFRNITYFPMTWQFAVEDFGWQTQWSSGEGFQILIDKEVKEEPDYIGYYHLKEYDTGFYVNFSLFDEDDNDMAADGIAHIVIVDKYGNVVFEEERVIKEQYFEERGSVKKKYGVDILTMPNYIQLSDVLSSDSNAGTVYMQFETEAGTLFEWADIEIDFLPMTDVGENRLLAARENSTALGEWRQVNFMEDTMGDGIEGLMMYRSLVRIKDITRGEEAWDKLLGHDSLNKNAEPAANYEYIIAEIEYKLESAQGDNYLEVTEFDFVGYTSNYNKIDYKLLLYNEKGLSLHQGEDGTLYAMYLVNKNDLKPNVAYTIHGEPAAWFDLFE